jgi:peptidoglycan/xylan/chitin deacetylase (PgdA/CDA1 family)
VKGSAPGIFLVALLLLPGCAIREIQPVPPQPVPSKVPAPPRQAEPSFERIFPEFAAVVAREGDTFASLAARYLGDPGMNWFVEEFNGIRKITPGAPVVIPLAPFDPLGITGDAYQTVPVLCYHKFSKTTSDKMTVTEDSFEAQMRFLKVNGYQVIPLDRLFDFLDGKAQIPKKSVVVTIDDGWRSTYEIAYPILRKYGYPATLFVYTDFVGGGANALTWEMIVELSRNGVDIQCHTKTHRNLSRRFRRESFNEYFDSLKKEIGDSTRIIQKHLKKEIRYLAYPYGDTNHLVVSLVAKAGYRGAFTVERGGNPFFTPAYRVDRSIIYGSYDLQDFENNLVIASGKALH